MPMAKTWVYLLPEAERNLPEFTPSTISAMRCSVLITSDASSLASSLSTDFFTASGALNTLCNTARCSVLLSFSPEK